MDSQQLITVHPISDQQPCWRLVTVNRGPGCQPVSAGRQAAHLRAWQAAHFRAWQAAHLRGREKVKTVVISRVITGETPHTTLFCCLTNSPLKSPASSVGHFSSQRALWVARASWGLPDPPPGGVARSDAERGQGRGRRRQRAGWEALFS